MEYGSLFAQLEPQAQRQGGTHLNAYESSGGSPPEPLPDYYFAKIPTFPTPLSQLENRFSSSKVPPASIVPEIFGLNAHWLAPISVSFLLTNFSIKNTPITSIILAGAVMAFGGAILDLHNSEAQDGHEFLGELLKKVVVGALTGAASAFLFRKFPITPLLSPYNKLCEWFGTTRFANSPVFKAIAKPAFKKAFREYELEGHLTGTTIPGGFKSIRRLTTTLNTGLALLGGALCTADALTDSDPYSKHRIDTLWGAWGGTWAGTWLLCHIFPFHTPGYLLISAFSVWEDYRNQKEAWGRRNGFHFEGLAWGVSPGFNGGLTILNSLANVLIFGVGENIARDGKLLTSFLGMKKIVTIPLGPLQPIANLFVDPNDPTLNAGKLPTPRKRLGYAGFQLFYNSLLAPVALTAIRHIYDPESADLEGSLGYGILGALFMTPFNFFRPLLGSDRPAAKLFYMASYGTIMPLLASTSNYYDASPSFYRSPLLHLLDDPKNAKDLEQARELMNTLTLPQRRNSTTSHYFQMDAAKDFYYSAKEELLAEGVPLVETAEGHMFMNQRQILKTLMSEETPRGVKTGFLKVLEQDARAAGGDEEAFALYRLWGAAGFCQMNNTEWCDGVRRIANSYLKVYYVPNS